MPFESEKLLNKRLTGYVVETGKVGFENDSSWMTFKIINDYGSPGASHQANL